MKNAIIAMAVMAIFMVGGGGVISAAFSSILGGGIEQSYIYPIYGGIIILTGVVVGAAQMVIDEIRALKKLVEENKNA